MRRPDMETIYPLLTLCGESTSHMWNPSQIVSNADLEYLLLVKLDKPSNKQPRRWFQTPWDTWRHCDVLFFSSLVTCHASGRPADHWRASEQLWSKDNVVPCVKVSLNGPIGNTFKLCSFYYWFRTGDEALNSVDSNHYLNQSWWNITGVQWRSP